MKENTFTVDLGTMQLSEEHRAKINTAIQQAVAGQLAGAAAKGLVALVPANNWHIGPITNGIIARPINEKTLEGLLSGNM